MVNLLVGSRDIKEINILQNNLTNDKNYKINNAYTGKQIIDQYWKINPDIAVIDNNLNDLFIENVIDILSCSPLEEKNCNLILTLDRNYNLKLNNVSKINKIIYKPINNDLIKIIKKMAVDHNTPDLEFGEVDLLLQSLNFNCMSTGYRYMRDAITYCYYNPEELEFLKNIFKYLSFKYKVSENSIKDVLNSSIRPFNNTYIYNCSNDLKNLLYKNISLKDFIERIVFYLINIKHKGRIF